MLAFFPKVVFWVRTTVNVGFGVWEGVGFGFRVSVGLIHSFEFDCKTNSPKKNALSRRRGGIDTMPRCRLLFLEQFTKAEQFCLCGSYKQS